MHKIINPIELVATPPALDSCFDILKATDPNAPFALFGGAVRDADYAAYHGEPRAINDYDLRVLLPDDDHDERVKAFVAHLGVVSKVPFVKYRALGQALFGTVLNTLA